MFHKEKIVIYTTPICPYCTHAKKLLNTKGYKYSEIDVSDPSLRSMLTKKAQGKKTVPQIFIGEMHVGGYDELSRINSSGELESIMQNI